MALTSAQNRAALEFQFTLRDMIASLPPSEIAQRVHDALAAHMPAEQVEAVLHRAAELARPRRS